MGRLFRSLVLLAATTLASVSTASHASGICTRMKATDTLILHGHSQHAERFVECIVGRWPDVHSVFREIGGSHGRL